MENRCQRLLHARNKGNKLNELHFKKIDFQYSENNRNSSLRLNTPKIDDFVSNFFCIELKFVDLLKKKLF